MNVIVYTSDPDNVTAGDIHKVLEDAGYLVLSVEVEC